MICFVRFWGSKLFVLSVIFLHVYYTHAFADSCDEYTLRIVNDANEGMNGVAVVVISTNENKQYFFSDLNGLVKFCSDAEHKSRAKSIEIVDAKYQRKAISLDDAVDNKLNIVLRPKGRSIWRC